ncbi:MAG TPA: DEAD/DEAH box helicase [Planctomycetaceae bacterium]|nr:DEAD/DEAH box helicase [Planctomycetaceae bacterium]
MTLAELLEEKFRGDVRFRGDAYLRAERVAVTRVTADEFAAIVRDGDDYRTRLTRDDGKLRMFCTCEAEGRREPACRHLWATIRTVDEGGFLSGSVRPGFVPPFVAEPQEPDLLGVWHDEGPGDVYFPSEPPGRSRGGTAVAVRLRDWEARLQSLRQELSGPAPLTASPTREREVFYDVDLRESRLAGRMVIQTSQRQRRLNGQWGKWKPLKLRTDQLDEIEHEDDRRILAFLTGGTPVRSTWFAQQAETQSAVHRYHVPHELCELILPMMCATGRVRLLDGEERSKAAVTWDDGPPWELVLKLEYDEGSAQWRLDGEIERPGRRVPIPRVQLLVPGGLAIVDGQVARLRDFDADAWVRAVQERRPIAVPDGEEQEFVDRLLDMPALPRLELPEELRLEEIRRPPVPHLVISSPAGPRWHVDRLNAAVAFDYAGTLIPAASDRWAIVEREHRRCLVRDRAAEERAWTTLHDVGFRRLVDQRRHRGRHDADIPARALGPAVRKLIAAGWQVRADGKQVRQPGELKLSVTSGIDWFELRGKVDFEGRSISFPELLSALGRGDGTVRLDDGSLGILPEEWARQFGLLAGLGVSDDDHVRFARNQAALLDALLAAQPAVDYDVAFTELRRKFDAFGGIEPTTEPAGFEGELRDYQRIGLGWLLFLEEFGFGGCLADDMGLGKTVQFLALLLARRRSRRKTAPSLVVVPKSVLFNWQQEAERFTPQLKVLEYVGLERAGKFKDLRKYDLVLTTYGTLRRDIVQLKDVAFDYAVLDEAQTIKNAASQVAKAARLLNAEHRLALSGTPIENHLGDLWSIFEFLNPGMLGRSSLFKMHATDANDDETRRLLSRGLRPFILRRTKAQVASELPEKIEQTIYCRMGKDQRRQYNELRDHYRASLMGLVDAQGIGKSKMHVLEALLRLRQAACHPALLDRADATAERPYAKLDALIPQVEELLSEGHKALVFSQFTSMLAIVRRHLDERQIVYEYLDGQTRNRGARVKRFQTDSECGLFLISLKAGGLGLNLTAADYVFLLDPWWNPAVEMQAIDRAHRVGQTRQVIAYRLICRNTVEEKIAELQGKKRSLAEAILEADASVLQDLTREDLEMLLS